MMSYFVVTVSWSQFKSSDVNRGSMSPKSGSTLLLWFAGLDSSLRMSTGVVCLLQVALHSCCGLLVSAQVFGCPARVVCLIPEALPCCWHCWSPWTWPCEPQSSAKTRWHLQKKVRGHLWGNFPPQNANVFGLNTKGWSVFCCILLQKLEGIKDVIPKRWQFHTKTNVKIKLYTMDTDFQNEINCLALMKSATK